MPTNSLDKFNIKPSILEITPYKPGKSKIAGSQKVIKLSSNENALGSSPLIEENKEQLLKSLNRYPDGTCNKLKEDLANLHNINQEQIICGAGSDELINLIIQAFTREGDSILATDHGFLMYKIYAQSHNVEAISAQETNYKTDIENIIKAIKPNTRVIFLANPNNPTGTYLNYSQLQQLHQSIPENIILVIDEAYAEYVSKDDYQSAFNLAKQFDNIIVTRTFSKIYGLAALRLGYAYSSPEIIDILNRIRSPFNVTQTAQNIGSIALADQEFIKNSRNHNYFRLKKLEKFLDSIGIPYIPPVANFILLDLATEEKAKQFTSYLAKNNIIVREVAEYGLPDKVRITIGTQEENEHLMQAIKSYIN